jgi:hypothetical protein
MSHSLIGVLSAACIVAAAPLAAQAAEHDALPMPQSFAAQARLPQSGYAMLHANLNGRGGQISPALFGPDVSPQWKMRALSDEYARPSLQGDRFRFR